MRGRTLCGTPSPPTIPSRFDVQPDTINALWEAAELDNRDGTTFVDVVDFCFNCVLFLEREKEVETLP